MPADVTQARIDARVLGGLAGEFAAAGLPGSLLPEPSAPGRLRLCDFVAALEAAGDRSREPGFLWRCGRNFAPAGLSEFVPELRAGAALGDAITTFVEALNGLQSDSLIRFRVERGLAILEYRVLDPSIWPRSRDVEFTFGFIDGMVRLYGGEFAPEAVVFEHGLARPGLRLDAALGRACIYGEPINRLALPEGLLAAGDRSAPRVESASIRAAYAPRPSVAADDLSPAVRRAVLGLIGEGPIDQRTVARATGLSPRTLRRRLAAVGRCFRSEIESIKADYAASVLERTDLPAGEIGRRLGYADQSSFTRAFTRATGKSPRAFRKSARAAVTLSAGL